MASGGPIQEEDEEEDEEEDKNDDVFGPEKQALTNNSPTGKMKILNFRFKKCFPGRRGGRDLGQQDHLHAGHHRVRCGTRQRLAISLPRSEEWRR